MRKKEYQENTKYDLWEDVYGGIITDGYSAVPKEQYKTLNIHLKPRKVEICNYEDMSKELLEQIELYNKMIREQNGYI